MDDFERSLPVELTRPNPARVYNYMLGGSYNFSADREFAQRLLAVYPEARRVAVANRAFLRRSVDACVAAGVVQFLDIGSGVPTAGSVHEIARARNPSSRVAYVDVDPVAVSCSEQMLDGIDGVSITAADLRDPEAVLSAPTVLDVLDFSQPVALLAVAVLHFVPADDDLPSIMDRYRAALVVGSVVVCSHGSLDFEDADAVASTTCLADITKNSTHPACPRSRVELGALVDGFDVVDPGMVDITSWRPEVGDDYYPSGLYGFMARRC